MASSGTAVVTLPTDTQILITREFAAPRHLVYKAWTTPELIKRWWSANRGVVTVADVDLRVGGKWRWVMVTHSGFECAFHGEYRQIVENERLVHTEVFEGAPDAGAVKRAEDFRQSLAKALGRDVRNAFIEKYRSAGVVTGHAVVGDVRGGVAVLLDDLISSGTTMVRAAEACRERGATAVYAVATHAVLGRGAQEALSSDALDKVLVTDSVGPRIAMAKLQVLSVAGLFADAITRIHRGGSVVELLEG